MVGQASETTTNSTIKTTGVHTYKNQPERGKR